MVAGEQLLLGYQKNRNGHIEDRLEAVRDCNRLRNQADVPPETIPAYVEAKAMQKRAENKAAANYLFIAEFIKTVQLNTV